MLQIFSCSTFNAHPLFSYHVIIAIDRMLLFLWLASGLNEVYEIVKEVDSGRHCQVVNIVAKLLRGRC